MLKGYRRLRELEAKQAKERRERETRTREKKTLRKPKETIRTSPTPALQLNPEPIYFLFLLSSFDEVVGFGIDEFVLFGLAWYGPVLVGLFLTAHEFNTRSIEV